MEFNRSYLLILVILGIILLYSYYYYFTNDKRSISLWGRIKGNLLNIYYFSMLAAALGFLLLFYYLIIGKSFSQSDNTKLIITLFIMLVLSMLWMPLSLKYLDKKEDIYKYLVLLVLLLVSISIIYLLYTLYNVKEYKNILTKNIAFIGMIYYFIHAFFFDFILWSYNFF
jgi:hypothetical protein